MRARWIGPLAGLLLLTACEAEEAALDPLPSPALEEEIAEPVAPPPPSDVQAQMHDRYDTVTAMRGALVRGELEAARALARGVGPVRGELPPEAHELRDLAPSRAAVVARAEDVVAAARAYGAMLEGCGRCHAAAGATWSYETPARPDGPDPVVHMRRHAWAVDRMTEALIVRDADRFDMGANALAEAPLGEGSAVEAIAARVHARAASPVETMEARAAVFGDVVAACAECHRHFEGLEAARVR